ncbi:hypothetical protein MSG28_011296 [Choristoneura fumiferana]|uniref:Uncharacterized protein n=1 Tax=Choristoneura fumiferana TaxID=7141 RepID=A0ACC0KR71_CHOFU|nr:hypothetical protein MSG28_011296 [Choristoneura fumiferana]
MATKVGLHRYRKGSGNETFGNACVQHSFIYQLDAAPILMSFDRCAVPMEGLANSAIFALGNQAHFKRHVMLASILVVVGMWWLVRTLLSLVINLICPLMVVVMAVVCVPQLREPLIGQNYPALANLLKSILLKLAENIKTS